MVKPEGFGEAIITIGQNGRGAAVEAADVFVAGGSDAALRFIGSVIIEFSEDFVADGRSGAGDKGEN